jgi:hypothetical protein
MKRLAALVTIGALATTGCAGVLPRATLPAGASWRWDNVVALPQAALIRVTTFDHRAIEGTLIAADHQSLEVQTRHGVSSFQVPIVLRVERLAGPRKSRVRTALGSATAGVASVVIVTALFSQATAGRLSAPSAKSVARAAALFGGLGALGPSRHPITIYVRPRVTPARSDS